jgi:hypothetical protein
MSREFNNLMSVPRGPFPLTAPHYSLRALLLSLLHFIPHHDPGKDDPAEHPDNTPQMIVIAKIHMIASEDGIPSGIEKYT